MKTNSLTTTLCFTLLLGLAGTGVATQAQTPRQQGLTTFQRMKQMAQGPQSPSGPPLFIPGELVVRLAAGANSADAQTLAAHFGGQVKRKLRFAPNTYVFHNIQGSLDQAVSTLHTSPAVVRATTNQVFRPSALPPSNPNDPLFPQQWALKSVGAENLWGITVGQRLVEGPKQEAVVALLDSGPQISHPDLVDIFDSANAWDFILDQPYDEDVANQFFFDNHGTSVAGCIAPETNNSEGIAGLPWEGVKILPCRVADSFGLGTLNFGIPVSAVVDAIYYSIQQQVDVINMSFGLNNTDALVQQAIIDAHNQGIVPVASSGDGFFFSRAVEFPATLPQVIAVGAVGPSGEPASYSNLGPQVDIAAPGGNDANFNDVTRQVIVAVPTDFIFGPVFGFPIGYNIDQGTSYAAGYVSGGIATLITQGAGDGLTGPARVAFLQNLIQSTARNPFGRITPELGNGILDMDAAIRTITQYADVIAPEPNEVTASVSEPLTARIVLPVLQVLEEGDFQVFKNGEDVTEDAVILDSIAGIIEYEPSPEDAYLTGVNRLNIISEHPSGDPELQRSLERDAVFEPGVNIPAGALLFRVDPRIEYPGLKMFSIPHELDDEDGADTLNFLLGGNQGRLARWLPEQNRYAIFDPFGSPQEEEASLTTTNAGVARPPVGVGFFLRIIPAELPPPPDGELPTDPAAQQVRLQIRGRSERAPFYNIPLKPGFNLIGTPYAFRIPFNVVNVRFGNEVMSVTEAARRRLIQGVIWRLQEGRYTFQALPHGELVPWEAHWIRSFANVTLIVPRVGAGLGVASAGSPEARVAAKDPNGSWRSALRVSTGSRLRGEVVVGQAGRKNPEARVELPPAPAGEADLRIRGDHGLRLVQELRPVGRKKETWLVEYETSSPGETVKLSWDRFPKGANVLLEMEGSKARDLGKSASVTFTPQRTGVHKLRLTVQPRVSGLG